MRISLQKVCALLLFVLLCFAKGARAQNPDTIAPQESEARAKRILQQLIEAKGGPAYLGMTSSQCEGRRALIGHNGELSGYVGFKVYWEFPDKERTDYIAHARNTVLGYIIGVQDLDITHGGTVITLFNGDHGWVMDKSGVSELPDAQVSQFQEALRQSPDNLIRNRLKEPGINYRWAGLGTVDLHPVDWIEIVEQDGRTTKLAVDRSTHLLVRSKVVTQDEELNQSREDVIIFTNYHPKGGVQVPMQVTRERDGRRIAQVFYDECQANPPLPADFFTREALEKRYKDVGGKMKPSK